MQELHIKNANIQIQSWVEHDTPHLHHTHTHTNYSSLSVVVGRRVEVALMKF